MSEQILYTLPLETWNTIYMVFASAFLASLCGLPLAILLFLLSKQGMKSNPALYRILNGLVNAGRSFPFAILMISVIPLTRWIVGTSLGTTASIVPLTIAAIPFAARLFEDSISQVDRHVVDAALMMGSTTRQIVYKVLLPEALPSLISSITLLIVTLVGYSAMAGMAGGGGLGKVAIQYGYMRFDLSVMIATVCILIVLVQVIQMIGHALVKKINLKRGIVHP